MRLFILFASLLTLNAGAQVYSPQAQESNFKINAYFYSQEERDEDVWIEEADAQLAHTFALFQTPEMIKSYGLDANLVLGIGAIQIPTTYQILSSEEMDDGTVRVEYQATGKILLHNKVMKDLEKGGELKVPLPVRLDDFYLSKCTDPHYDTIGDFWYFYNPFKVGCSSLRKLPLADNFTIEVGSSTKRKLDLDMRLDLLRGDNDNGKVFRIDVIHGFDESSTSRNDDGRVHFKQFAEYLLEQGYQKTSVQRHKNRPLDRFTKTLKLKNGRTIEVEINSLLVDTEIESRTTTFAKFFQSAVNEADVIFYTGHSGLGGHLDVNSLEAKVGKYKFNPKKRQIFMFDSCSSYSYYLAPFRDEKSRAKIDVVTMGLASLFETSLVTLTTFVEELTDTKVEDKAWPQVLKKIESRMDGYTYLINVGGI